MRRGVGGRLPLTSPNLLGLTPGKCRSGRVLVVENESALARHVGRLIARSGRQPLLVPTLCDAQRALDDETSSWVALIVGESLPDGSGLRLLSWARARRCNVPALVLTGRLDREVANTAFDLGASCLVKPARRAHLERFLSRSESDRGEPRSLEHFSAGGPNSSLGLREPMSLARATWEYVREVVSTSPTRSLAAKRLGIEPRSLRRMLSKERPPW